MTASVSDPYAGASPSKHTGARLAVAALGLATVVLGVVLLFNPVKAANTLALLIGLALVLGGLLEIAHGWDSRSRAGSVLLGGILVVGGIVAVAWPDSTLRVLAVVAGISLMAHGVGRFVLALVARRQITGWGWLALDGVFGFVVGVLAIAWPEATVLVLSLLLGAQVTVLGLLVMAAAFLPSGTRDAVPGAA
ncbi:HdeD family acid-resistance protein [Blastococcus sp. SYSU D00695]